jgi:hypothetical protein
MSNILRYFYCSYTDVLKNFSLICDAATALGVTPPTLLQTDRWK